MFDYKKIDDIIENYLEEEGEEWEDCFFGEASSSTIAFVEKELGVTLPVSYKKFLRKYGAGGIEGTTYWGIESNEEELEKNTVIFATKNYREKGLPQHLVVFEDLGEYVVCLDTKEMNEEGECPVVTWSCHDNDDIVFSEENFYTYFLEQLEEYL